MAVLTALFASFNWIFQEQLFTKYNTHALEGCFFISLYGTILGGVVLIFGQLCRFEDVKGIFYQMQLGSPESHTLIIGMSRDQW